METPVILLSRLPLIALAGAVAAALAACETPPPRPTFPELTWTHLQPFSLDVAEIEITSDYAPPLAPPHVEHLFPTPPCAPPSAGPATACGPRGAKAGRWWLSPTPG